MKRLLLAVTFTVLLASSWITGSAVAQQAITKDQLVGTWSLSSTVNLMNDGTRFDPYGGKGAGLLMFDDAGHFSLQIIRRDMPRFASNNRTKGTAAEYEAVAVGTLAYFGTYRLDDTGKTMSLHIENSSFGNFSGTDQKRTVALAGDELTLTNAAAASGGTATLTWKRAK